MGNVTGATLLSGVVGRSKANTSYSLQSHRISHTGDISGGVKFYNVSRGPDHTQLGDSQSSKGQYHSWPLCPQNLKSPRSFKVTSTGAIRQATYDFLLVESMSLSCTVLMILTLICPKFKTSRDLNHTHWGDSLSSKSQQFSQPTCAQNLKNVALNIIKIFRALFHHCIVLKVVT